MSRVVVRTIYGSAVQTNRSMGLTHEIPAFSTLNEALSNNTIIANLPTAINRGMRVAPAYDANADTNSLKVGFFCIGNGGHRFIQGPDPQAPAYTTPIPHRATDSGLYRWIPFIVRPIANDGVGFDPADYRLRRTLDIGGNIYVAYYAKRLDLTGVESELTRVDYNAGNPVTTPNWLPNINNLKPTQPTDSTVTANNGSYVSVAASLTIPFTAQEVQELIDAMTLLFNNPNFAVISEIALCTGVDKQCTGEYTNAASPVLNALSPGVANEIVGAQVATHISTYYPVVYANDGFGLTMDLGATEPLFGVGSS